MENEWMEYECGSYDKKFYDVETFDGDIYLEMWPNAGYFTNGPDSIYETEIKRVRLGKLNNERIGKL